MGAKGIIKTLVANTAARVTSWSRRWLRSKRRSVSGVWVSRQMLWKPGGHSISMNTHGDQEIAGVSRERDDR